MEDDKFKDLLEDEELTALRLAALATKRKNEQNLNKSESVTAHAQPIDSIVTPSELESNHIPFVQSHRNTHNNYSWLKQNQSQRRFPKSQRSNLIVISPVTLNDGKNSEEKAPPLILPQHKWCNSGNEDSMSPKTLRRTGPTRFNRHGSDSESSEDESDYEPSDNDSGSNETILQDEPSEHFARLSPGCDNLSDSVEKKRRLSFQSLDSDVKSETYDKNEATSVYKSLKSSLYSDTNQDKYAVQQHLNDGEHTFANSDENRYSNSKAGQTYTNKFSDLSENLGFKQSNSSVVTDINNSVTCYSKEPQSSQNFRLNDGNHKSYLDKRQSLHTIVNTHGSRNSVWQHNEGFKTENSLYPIENQCISADSKTYNDNSDKSQYLSESDLRLELKKRVQEMKSKSTCIEDNEMTENRRYAQYNSWDRNRQRYSHKGNEVDSSSLNSFGETQTSAKYQADRINQKFTRENDNIEHSSSFNKQRSCRSISRERTSEESFSGRDKKRSEYSFDGRRYDRSSSVDRSRNARSSSQERRKRERSSSQDEMRHERSSSHGKIKHNSIEDLRESSLSPSRNKPDHSYKHNKGNDDQTVTGERRDWYKPSPKEKPELTSNQERSKLDCNSSTENKHRRSTSLDRKLSLSNSRHKEYNADEKDRYHTQCHEKTYQSRGRSRHRLNSSHDRNKREHSLSRDRSRHGSSRSPDSRSVRSSSLEKNRYSSSLEGSKDEQSSSDNESRYKYNSKGAYNASKFPSNQHKNKHNSVVYQKTNVKENESKHDVVENCNSSQDKMKCALNSEKNKDEEASKLSTKDQSMSIEQDKFSRSNSKEKILTSKKTHQEYSSVRNSYKKHCTKSRSSSSESCSSSYSSSSSHSSRPKIRSVPSVIKPVLVKSDTDNRGNIKENKPFGKTISLILPQSSVHSICTKKNLDNVEINKPSNIKCGRIDGDPKASEGKRVPVHMRLGVFPRKRVIQMPKDVEAAFVNSSSSSDDETVNTKCKRQNIRIITDMYDAKNRIDLIQQKYSSDDNPAKRPSPDIYKEKFKRVKAHR